MERVWAVQRKHLPCITDPPGMELYTKTGTLEKGGKRLPILRCARGSSSLESFHRHQCAFIPGWRANAVHTQMYMIEGGSRWNINRAREALDLENSSGTRMYDIRLMANINSLSQKILKKDLLPEFKAPGQPTDERIAVDYLLNQSGQGDLLALNKLDDGEMLPELSTEEAMVEEFDDKTVCRAEDTDGATSVSQVIRHTKSSTPSKAKEPVVSGVTGAVAQQAPCVSGVIGRTKSSVPLFEREPVVSGAPLRRLPSVSSDVDPVETSEPSEQESTISDETKIQCEKCGKRFTNDEMVLHVFDHASDTQVETLTETSDTSLSPESSKESREDSRGYPGWEAVDALAAVITAVDTSATALSKAETDLILELYKKLHPMDKSPTKYALKSKKSVLPGPWRASRKREGATPGVQATERLYMTHGQAAQSPDTNRLSECVCLHLLSRYQQLRNRPKDSLGRMLSLQQAVVHTYSKLQQLLSDSRAVQETNIVLVTINNTTFCKWLNERQKRANREALLKGTTLPERVTTSRESLPDMQNIQQQHAEHGHEEMLFPEPENKQGKAPRNPRKRSVTETQPQPPTWPSPLPPTALPPGYIQPGQWQGWPIYQPMYVPPYPPVQPPPAEPESTPTPTPRQRGWRHRKAAQEDRERVARGEPPLKRKAMEGQYRYICSKCGKQKCAATGHTQLKGKWYCPSMDISIEEWKNNMLHPQN